jgi:hypothetical protein
MFNVKISVRVKFRAFFIDFANFEKRFSVALGSGISYTEITEEVPATAKKILDQRGVVVKLWV